VNKPIKEVYHKRITDRSVQIGVRVPLDVIVALDALCTERRLMRSEIIVAALRAHLRLEAPAAKPVRPPKPRRLIPPAGGLR
jgi:hypothetical protein